MFFLLLLHVWDGQRAKGLSCSMQSHFNKIRRNTQHLCSLAPCRSFNVAQRDNHTVGCGSLSDASLKHRCRFGLLEVLRGPVACWADLLEYTAITCTSKRLMSTLRALMSLSARLQR